MAGGTDGQHRVFGSIRQPSAHKPTGGRRTANSLVTPAIASSPLIPGGYGTQSPSVALYPLGYPDNQAQVWRELVVGFLRSLCSLRVGTSLELDRQSASRDLPQPNRAYICQARQAGVNSIPTYALQPPLCYAPGLTCLAGLVRLAHWLGSFVR